MSDFAVPNSAPGKCAKCSGSGIYRWNSKGKDGKIVRQEGSCHSCGGAGVQTRSDIARNNAYNRFKLSCAGA